LGGRHREMRVTVIAHSVKSIHIAHLGPSGQSGAIVAILGHLESRSTSALGFAAAPGIVAKGISAEVLSAVTRKRRKNRNAARMIARLATGMSGRHATRNAGQRRKSTRGPSLKTHIVRERSARLFRRKGSVKQVIPVKMARRRASMRNVARVW
jgi:hypothetical protein